MKRLISIVLCNLLLTACATNYHYQSENKPQQWVGQNIAAVQKKWGLADQVFHTRSGTTYWVYSSTSGANFFDSTTNNFAMAETGYDYPLRGQFGLQCQAIFKTDKNNVVIATSHSGSNCGGEFAPGKAN